MAVDEDMASEVVCPRWEDGTNILVAFGCGHWAWIYGEQGVPYDSQYRYGFAPDILCDTCQARRLEDDGR